MLQDFQFYRTPRIIFGFDTIWKLSTLCKEFGSKVLIVTGVNSLKNSGVKDRLISHFDDASIHYGFCEISGEPTPEMIDRIVIDWKDKEVDCVIGIGGGSVIDAGKAISAMLVALEPIQEYLEDVGTKKPSGKKVPYIAVPTTSGTGSEASANAVITRFGSNGFKKSLRHTNYVPDIALVDPLLTLSCPPNVTAACGLDAFTQLLESYVSINASTLTDSLVEKALPLVNDNLVMAFGEGALNHDVRAALSYASMVSGITLANAGLGVVHGFASSIGGFFEIPHGVVCARLLAASTKITIDKLLKEQPSSPSLKKYANTGAILSKSEPKSIEYGCKLLLDTIDWWTSELEIPTLSSYGVRVTDFNRIVKMTGNKNNPIKLNTEELVAILEQI